MGQARFQYLRLDQLNLPQPALRTERRKLGALATSIDAVGVLVPLVVRALGKSEPVGKKSRGGRREAAKEEYVVVAGAGRLEALWQSGAAPDTLVPCVIVDVDDAEATLLALVENTVREPMRAFDEAEAARVLVEDYGYTQARVAKAIGVTPPAISQQLAVFALDATVIAALRTGEIEMRTAYALLPLKGDAKAQRSLMKRIRAEGLSAAAVAAVVAARVHGDRGIAPLKYSVRGTGRVEARTTRTGKLRIVLEAGDLQGLAKLWSTVRAKLG